MTHVTIVGNRASQARAGGIYKESGLLYLRNSVVAGSILGDDCYGLLDQSRGNFSQDGTCGTQPGGDPLLDELTGTPAHHPLQHNSPAHGAADPSFCLPTDQLGQPRRAAWCDIGAVETERDSSAPPARAAIPPDCSLGDQIVAANTDAPAGACPAGDGADTISLTKDLRLSGPLPPITSDITIRGNGHTLDGAGRYRIFDIGGEGFPHVAIKHLTLVNGSAPKEHGGAIRLNKGRLTVTDAIFSNNQAESGGAIASGENTYLKIYNSRFSFNTAAAQGGALFYSGCIRVDTTVFFNQNSSRY